MQEKIGTKTGTFKKIRDLKTDPKIEKKSETTTRIPLLAITHTLNSEVHFSLLLLMEDFFSQSGVPLLKKIKAYFFFFFKKRPFWTLLVVSRSTYWTYKLK